MWKIVKVDGEWIIINKLDKYQSVKLISGKVHRFPVIQLPQLGERMEQGISWQEILAGYVSLLKSTYEKACNLTNYLLLPWLTDKENRKGLR